MQRRALRIVFKQRTSLYTHLLSRANVNSLYVTRIKSIATETYKSIHQLNPSFLHTIFDVKDTGYGLRDMNRLHKPNVTSTNFGLKSFTFEASKIWNDLPPSIKVATTITKFKSNIKVWKGPTCSCQDCVLCKINMLWPSGFFHGHLLPTFYY